MEMISGGHHRRRPCLWQVLALVVCLSACSVPPQMSGWAVVDRLVDVDPKRSFDLTEVIASEPVKQWTFVDDGQLSRWKANISPREMAIDDGRLHITPERRYVTISRAVELDASTVDAFEIIVKGVAKRPVGVRWQGDGGGPAKERHVQTEVGRSLAGGARSFRLVVRGNPHWRGTIREVLFHFTVPESRSAQLLSIHAVDERVSEQALAHAVAQSWKVDIGNDLRNAVLTPPGMPTRFAATVPKGGRLSYAFGRPGTSDEVEHVIHVIDDTERVELFAGSGNANEWVEGRLDLAAYSGREITFELSTTVASGAHFDPVGGLPAWANVEVEGPTQETMPNVLLISLDTLRADRLSTYGYHRPTSPNIDRWAASATVFEQAVASAPWTLPSHVSMLTGLDADHHGANFNRGAARSHRLLSEYLQDAGYATAAVTGGGYLHAQYGFARGFDAYRAWGVAIGNDQEIEVGTEHALKFLENRDGRPWFLFFHSYEVHNPFRPRPPLAEELGLDPGIHVDTVVGSAEASDGYLAKRGIRLMVDGKEREAETDELNRLASDLYDCGVAYADQYVGRLLDRLKERGFSENTVVVLTSDHGEVLGEHGMYNHISLYDENVHIPLIVDAPGAVGAGSRIAAQVRSIDIVPSILEAVGLTPDEIVDGRSLVPFLDGSRSADDHLGPAWSFAVSSNHGVALREEARHHFILRNGGWVSPDPREDLFVRDGQTGWIPADDLSVVEETLRTSVQHRTETRFEGLRLRIDARSSTSAITGRIHGPMVMPDRVKVALASAAVLEARGKGSARFSVEPGEVHTLIFEGRHHKPLTLELETTCSGRPAPSFEITPSTARTGLGLRCTADGWVEDLGAPGTKNDSEIFAWFLGSGHHEAETEIDDALRQQLEALGYVVDGG